MTATLQEMILQKIMHLNGVSAADLETTLFESRPLL